MGARKSRFFALLIAVVMIFTSAIGVFAAESPKKDEAKQATPTTNNIASVVHANDGTIDVPAGATVTSNGVAVAVSGTSASVASDSLVVVTSGSNVDNRWIKTTKIKKSSKKKFSWKKVNGANYYQVRIMKAGKVVGYKIVYGTKITAKKLGLKSLKGYTVAVRPVKVVNGVVYSGALSKAKKIKK